jgi:hypothetical protein
LKRKLPLLELAIKHTAAEEEKVRLARIKEDKCVAGAGIINAKLTTALADVKRVRLEGMDDGFNNPDCDIPGVAARSKSYKDTYEFLLSLLEQNMEVWWPEATIETLEAMVEQRAWESTQYTLAAEIAQLQLNVSLSPAPDDVISEPISANVLALRDAAAQAEYALQSAREALRNAKLSHEKMSIARMSAGLVRRPIYS